MKPAGEDEATVKTWLTSRTVPVYEISNVATFLAEGNADFSHLEHFPNVAPVHVIYWMEWRAPTRVVPMFKEAGTEPERVGVLVWQSGPPVENEWPVSIHAWGIWKGHKRVEPLVSWEVTMRPYGTPTIDKSHIFDDIARLFERPTSRIPTAGTVELPFVESEEHAKRLHADYTERLRKAEAAKKDAVRQLDEVWGTWVRYAVLHPTLMAHSLLSCKNVEVEERHPPPKLSKAHQRRTGEPLVSFKTLRVTPMGGRGDNAPSGDGLDRPLHIVRGHFKTFTPERPLFGRLVGTYWWSSTLRGSAEHGVVVKDYEVAVPDIIDFPASGRSN